MNQCEVGQRRRLSIIASNERCVGRRQLLMPDPQAIQMVRKLRRWVDLACVRFDHGAAKPKLRLAGDQPHVKRLANLFKLFCAAINAVTSVRNDHACAVRAATPGPASASSYLPHVLIALCGAHLLLVGSAPSLLTRLPHAGGNPLLV